MTRRQAAIAVVALAAVIPATLQLSCRAAPDDASQRIADDGTPRVEADGDRTRLELYFPGAGGWLVSEERQIPAEGEGADLRAIVAEVLAGPATPDLYAPFPDGTEVGSVFISDDDVAYVDLTSTQANPPRSGSRQEMLSVYSVVNSVHANLPDLAGVVLLWNGQQRATFAGHLDTGRPLTEDRSLVAR